MRRRLFVQRIIVVALVGLLAATIAGPALAAPPTRDFGPQIDAYARYEGQTGCSSVEQPGVRDFRAILQRHYGANGAGILRSCASGGRSEHKEGRAYDWMLNAHNAGDRQKANEVLNWLLATDAHGNRHANARRLGIMYIIWNRQVWNAYRPNDGWRAYTGANPHTDHIHFSFSWAGARQQTTWWTAAATAQTAVAPGPFRDVPGNHKFVDEIEWVSDTEVSLGLNDGRFAPYRDVTRGQMATFLWRLMGEPKVDTPHGFNDVPRGAHYEPALRWARANDVIPATADGRFHGEVRLNRGHMAAWLHNLAGNPDASQPHSFRDVGPGNHYDDAVSWLVEQKITNGVTADEYRGRDYVIRGQMAAFLYRVAGTRGAWGEAEAEPAHSRW